MSVSFKIILVFLTWHVFFVGMKVLVSTLNVIDRRFLKGMIATVLCIAVAFLLITPGSFVIIKVTGFLVTSLKWAGEGAMTNFKEKLVIAICFGNLLWFSLAHYFARKSHNKIFKLLYDFNYPANDSVKY